VRAFGVSSAAPLPPPLEIEDNGACYIVKDKNGQALAMSISRRSLGQSMMKIRPATHTDDVAAMAVFAINKEPIRVHVSEPELRSHWP